MKMKRKNVAFALENCMGMNIGKNRARDSPLRGNYIGKIPNFQSFWGRKPTP